LHTLKTEYPAFGGTFEVVHHTQLIQELYASGRLEAAPAEALSGVAFHDPCYLGRHNGVFEAPRQALAQAGASAAELPRHGAQSFCCGAGGAQMWKEEERGTGRVSDERLREASEAGTSTLATGCPFCLIMLTDAAKGAGGAIAVRDVAEIAAERLNTAQESLARPR
jgi:Fe-S oxidoreductase